MSRGATPLTLPRTGIPVATSTRRAPLEPPSLRGRKSMKSLRTSKSLRSVRSLANIGTHDSLLSAVEPPITTSNTESPAMEMLNDMLDEYRKAPPPDGSLPPTPRDVEDHEARAACTPDKEIVPPPRGIPKPMQRGTLNPRCCTPFADSPTPLRIVSEPLPIETSPPTPALSIRRKKSVGHLTPRSILKSPTGLLPSPVNTPTSPKPGDKEHVAERLTGLVQAMAGDDMRAELEAFVSAMHKRRDVVKETARLQTMATMLASELSKLGETEWEDALTGMRFFKEAAESAATDIATPEAAELTTDPEIIDCTIEVVKEADLQTALAEMTLEPKSVTFPATTPAGHNRVSSISAASIVSQETTGSGKTHSSERSQRIRDVMRSVFRSESKENEEEKEVTPSRIPLLRRRMKSFGTASPNDPLESSSKSMFGRFFTRDDDVPDANPGAEESERKTQGRLASLRRKPHVSAPVGVVHPPVVNGVSIWEEWDD